MIPLLHIAWRGTCDAFGFLGRVVGTVMIWGYRIVLKPLFPTTCRFEPSCSEYALQAVNRHGLLYGGWLAARRLGRCNPWGPWGYDPVPEPVCRNHRHLPHAERPHARRAR